MYGYPVAAARRCATPTTDYPRASYAGRDGVAQLGVPFSVAVPERHPPRAK